MFRSLMALGLCLLLATMSSCSRAETGQMGERDIIYFDFDQMFTVEPEAAFVGMSFVVRAGARPGSRDDVPDVASFRVASSSVIATIVGSGPKAVITPMQVGNLRVEALSPSGDIIDAFVLEVRRLERLEVKRVFVQHGPSDGESLDLAAPRAVHGQTIEFVIGALGTLDGVWMPSAVIVSLEPSNAGIVGKIDETTFCFRPTDSFQGVATVRVQATTASEPATLQVQVSKE